MKRFIYYLFTAGAFLLGTHFAEAQIDTEFWFAAPEVNQGQHPDRPVKLHIATFGEVTSVTISIPANTGFTPIVISNIPAKSVHTHTFTDAQLGQIECNPRGKVNSTGLYVQSTKPITVYYEVLALGPNAEPFPLNPEIYGLKGKNALGKTFYVVGQNKFSNAFQGRESFVIVATQDNTRVKFNTKENCFGGNDPESEYFGGTTYEKVLQKGQTISITSQNDGGTLQGSKITADKPIAVTVSDDSIESRDPNDGSKTSIDLVGDQMFPVERCGLDHIVVTGIMNRDVIYVVATQNNTSIFINGSTTPIIKNEGEFHVIDNVSTSATFIRGSAPIYVTHLTGYLGNGAAMECAMSVIPPLGCTGTQEVSFVKNTYASPDLGEFDMMIIVKDVDKNNFKLNNAAYTPSFNAVAGNTEWVYAKANANNLAENQNYTLENSTGAFHLGLLIGYEHGGQTSGGQPNNNIVGSSYAFFSNYGTATSVNLGADREICNATNTTLDAGTGYSSYSWTKDGNPAVIATTQTLNVTTSGTYKVRVTLGICNAEDEISVTVLPPLPALAFVGLANNYCKNIPAITLAGTPTTTSSTFTIDGAVATSFNPANLAVGNRIVRYIYVDAKGCSSFIEKPVTVFALPALAFVGLANKYCVNGNTINLQASPTGGNFSINGTNTTVLNPNALGIGQHTVRYTYTDINSCTNTLDQTIEVVPISDNSCFNPDFFIPDLFSPNGDGKSDKFLVAGANIKSFSLKLFDRFGNMVYEAKTFEEASTKGWDGKKNDKDQPVGVYTWVLTGEKTDGTALAYKGAKRGVLNLIR